MWFQVSSDGKMTHVLQAWPKLWRSGRPRNEGGQFKGGLGDGEVSGSYLGLE